MMEIGSFIELQLPKGKEFYSGAFNIARLNSGRAAIWHSFCLTGCKKIWIPYYQCESVQNFLKRKQVDIKFYHMDFEFNPIDLEPKNGEAVLLVNYFGIMPAARMEKLAGKYQNVIIDNSQAFFAKPIRNCQNVYSARKFIGVPDGAYVIGEKAEQGVNEYEQGYSSDCAAFLLQRIEYGCEGKTYQSRMVNEERIEQEDICKMSALTRYILDGTDYDHIIKKRRENFKIASELFDSINQLSVSSFCRDECVPMVYPLLIEKEGILERLLSQKHFQGHWWNYVLNEVTEDTMEYWLSKYLIPVTIDQRYGMPEIQYIRRIVG